MPPPPHSSLPALGTSFPSIEAFMRVVSLVALVNSIRLKASTARDSCELRCSGSGDGSDDTVCDYFIRVNRLSSGWFEVDQFAEWHSCQVDHTPEWDAATRKRNQAQLDLLDRQAQRDKKSRTKNQTEPEKQAPSTRSSAKLASSADEEASPTAAANRKPGTSTVPASLQNKAQMSGEGYPHKTALVEEIHQLAKTGPYSLPPPTHLFNTPRELLIRIYAYLHHHPCSVHRRDRRGTIHIVCYGHTNTGCPLEFDLGEVDGGKWRLGRRNTQHSRSCPSFTNQPPSKADRTAPPPATASRPKHTSPPLQPLPPAKRHRPDPPPPPAQPTPLALHPAFSMPTPDPLFTPPHLAAFLSSLAPSLPPPRAADYALYLFRSGVSSLGLVVSLLDFDDSSFAAFAETLPPDPVRADGLSMALQEARRRWRADKRGS